MIYMIRHGQTDMNIQRRLQGRMDTPLNDAGRAQAETAAEWLRSRGVRFDRVISSPLRRAVDTARILAGEDVPLRTDERLMEIDCGPWEGADLRDPAPELGAFFSNIFLHPEPEGMEPLRHVTERLGEFLRDLSAEVSPEETVLIATHAIALKGALENLDPMPDGGWWNYPVHNCCGYAFALENGAYTKPEEINTQDNQGR